MYPPTVCTYLCFAVVSYLSILPISLGVTAPAQGRFYGCPLLWRHNGRDGVSTHQPHDCILNRLFSCRSKKTPKLHVTGLCAGNSLATGEFPAQKARNAESVFIWRRHHAQCECRGPAESSDNWWALANTVVVSSLRKDISFQFRLTSLFMFSWWPMVWNYHISTVVVVDVDFKMNTTSLNVQPSTAKGASVRAIPWRLLYCITKTEQTNKSFSYFMG